MVTNRIDFHFELCLHLLQLSNFFGDFVPFYERQGLF